LRQRPARAHTDRELTRADVVPMHRMQGFGGVALLLVVRSSHGSAPTAADRFASKGTVVEAMRSPTR
jgi:hypothetical protein